MKELGEEATKKEQTITKQTQQEKEIEDQWTSVSADIAPKAKIRTRTGHPVRERTRTRITVRSSRATVIQSQTRNKNKSRTEKMAL